MTTATDETAAVVPAVHAVTQRLRSGYERQDAVGMGELYADDATWELHVGGARVLLHGRPAIAARYAQDLSLPPTMLRWDVRPAPAGAVVEAEAEQGEGASRVRFRWVHLLTIEQGRITGDVVHCTGALPAPAAGSSTTSDGSPAPSTPGAAGGVVQGPAVRPGVSTASPAP